MKYFYIKEPYEEGSETQIYHINTDHAAWLYEAAAASRHIDYHEVEVAFREGRPTLIGTGPRITIWGQDNISDQKIFQDILNGTIKKEEWNVDVHS